MYVDTCNGGCVSLGMQLGATGVGTTLATRSWSIKVRTFSLMIANFVLTARTIVRQKVQTWLHKYRHLRQLVALNPMENVKAMLIMIYYVPQLSI